MNRYLAKRILSQKPKFRGRVPKMTKELDSSQEVNEFKLQQR